MRQVWKRVKSSMYDGWASEEEGHTVNKTQERILGAERVSVKLLKAYLKGDFSKVCFAKFLTAHVRVSGGKNRNKGLHVCWATGNVLNTKGVC